MSNPSPTQAFWLIPNVANEHKRVRMYPQPWKKDPEKSTAAVDPRHLKVEVADKDFPNCPML